jgi:hypothetical protein
MECTPTRARSSSSNPGQHSPAGARRNRWPLWLSLVYAAVLSACLVQAYRQESRANPSAAPGRTLAAALFARTEVADGSAYRDPDTERQAAFARGGAVLATLLYLLGLGLLLGPRPLRLIHGNLLVLVLALLAIEALTRLLGIHFPAVARRGAIDRDLWVYDRTKGWFHAPLGSGELFHGGPDRGLARINSLGLRGGEVSRSKPEGVKRVLVLGDSFVFGLGVDEDNLFTTHLEKLLNRSPDKRHEVLNLGVSGYSTDQEYILFQELGLRLSPDVVILVVCDNDFLGNTEDFAYRRYYKPYFERAADGLTLKNSPVPILTRSQRVKLFLGQESNVWNFVRNRSSDRPWVKPFLDFFQVGVPRVSPSDPVEITTALILALAERVEAAGARLFVINTGHRGEKTPLFHQLRPNLRGAGIHQLGLEETLANARRAAPEKNWDFPGDIHWNRDAHRLVAEVVDNYLSKFGLLSDQVR